MPKLTPEERKALQEARRAKRKALKDLEESKKNDAQVKSLIETRDRAKADLKAVQELVRPKRKALREAQQALIAKLTTFLPAELKKV